MPGPSPCTSRRRRCRPRLPQTRKWLPDRKLRRVSSYYAPYDVNFATRRTESAGGWTLQMKKIGGNCSRIGGPLVKWNYNPGYIAVTGGIPLIRPMALFILAFFATTRFV